MSSLSGQGAVTDTVISQAVNVLPTPFYLYDEALLEEKCRQVLNMPNAFGLKVSYAMKANSNRAILQIVHRLGFHIDASSLNEVRRAMLAGIPVQDIMLTTQEVPLGDDRRDMEKLMLEGLKYNVCSLLQLELIAGFASQHKLPLSIRIHPGVGTGESESRNTGDKYASFGVHQSDLDKVMALAREKSLVFDTVHNHIGSGGDPLEWRDNIDRELAVLEKWFPDAETINLGGGFKEARMPDETAVDVEQLGIFAREHIEAFYKRTGRKLLTEVEPGTYIIANACYLVTSVIDKKHTGADGFKFLILDGGMESSTRPLLYGSRHPFYVVSKEGTLLSSEFDLAALDPVNDLRVVAGRCCETGDTQCLDDHGHVTPRLLADPGIGDYVVIGGMGAYCSAMALHNYNSYGQSPELLLFRDGSYQVIRVPQSVEQMTVNERGLE